MKMRISVGLLLMILILGPRAVPGEALQEVCYQCHQDTEGELSLSSVHEPFREGRCTACHSPHASSHKGLVRDRINGLCYSCHQDLQEKVSQERMHGAIRDGLCTDCHSPHGSNNRSLLVRPQKEICFKCHKNLKKKINEDLTAHPPFNNGECSACHEPHASKEYNLLVGPSNRFCQRCHAPGCKVGDVSITDRTEKMECISCHTGHSANTAGLLGPEGHPDFLERNCTACHKPFVEGAPVELKAEGPELCFNCHVKDPKRFHEDDLHYGISEQPCLLCHNYHASDRPGFTVNERDACLECHADIDTRISRMTRKLKGIRCAPVKNRQCFGCHMPMHSTRPLYMKVQADVIGTCVACHRAQHKVSHPMGEGVKDPRDGSTITCKTCHSMHDARAEIMLRFDRHRELCIQCHKM